ncbi:adhesion G protein-coupled receptor A3-like [Saccoglossus kowalevskii]|uniref:Probable G-protein coupled receptor 125-like n=1 Tax=Saccoglossus kowalevskii TaxID=10224 RepID=A0ABM0N118_SACKO|nr:PREDICTED: probable G-protein coupled receptor 125-like [Saccoglossus kowalevskii]
MFRHMVSGHVFLKTMNLSAKRSLCTLVLVVIFSETLLLEVSGCPLRCTCSMLRSKPGEDPERTPKGRRIVCSSSGLDSPVEPTLMPADTVHLNLSGNIISILRTGTFMGLSSLERLDLSYNRISIIQPGAFEGLNSLKKLDLSGNRLGSINSSMFSGLDRLERLNLSDNQIATIPQGTFNSLRNLDIVDFKSDYLVCDCLMAWIPKWTKNNKRNIADTTTCVYPRALKGEKLRELRKRDLHCDYPLELPVFDLSPLNNQVVFLGDTLPMTCMATYLDESTRMSWFKDLKEVKQNASAGIGVEEHISRDRSIITSKLIVHNLVMSNGGLWECRVWTSRGNDSRAVSIIVLKDSAEFCPKESTSDNKGTISWPLTVAGIKSYRLCPRGAGSGYTGVPGKPSASRQCNINGNWEVPNTSDCQYFSTDTKWLEDLSLSNINSTNALRLAKELETQTSDAHTFSNDMDVVFIARTMEKFSKFIDQELGKTMINIASNVMEMKSELLSAGQRIEQACTRLVMAVEKFASDVLLNKVQIMEHIAPNIGLEAFRIKAESFESSPITCASFVRDGGVDTAYDDKHFKCFTANINSSQLNTDYKPVEASIQLPVSLVSKLRDTYSVGADTMYRLQFFVYKNGKLFPNTGNSTNYASNDGRRDVSSTVISSKIADLNVENLTDPVILTFRPRPQGADPVAGYWNFRALDGRGAWDTTGCKIVQQNENLTSVHCSHLTNFAILKDLHSPDNSMERMGGWNTGLLQPIVYVGSGVCVITILVTILTYICFNSQIRLSRKSVHTLMNLSLCIIMTVTAFTGGINRTEPKVICYGIGISIHYFTLCTLVWLAIASRNLNRRLCRKDKVLPPGEPPPPPRPMLRFYFVGWGLPIIVVGISAAADIKKYGSSDYCWLEIQTNLESSLQLIAFLSFVSLMFLVNIVYFISTSRKLQTMPRKYEVKQIEQNRENENAERDLPLTDLESIGTHTAATSVATSFLDAEHSYQSQLRSLVFIMFCFIGVWLFGAMTITQEYHLSLLFSYLYGAASTALGIFIFVYNCLLRTDVRLSWQRCCGCRRKTRYAYSVDSGAALQGNGHIYHHKQSASSIDSSFTNRSVTTNRSFHSNPGYRPVPQGRKMTNASIPSHTATYTDHSFDGTIDSRTHPYALQQRPNGYPPHHRYMQKYKNRPPNIKYPPRPPQLPVNRDCGMNYYIYPENRPQSRGSMADSHSSFPESLASTVRGGASHYSSEANTQVSLNTFSQQRKRDKEGHEIGRGESRERIGGRSRDKLRGEPREIMRGESHNIVRGESHEDCHKSQNSLPSIPRDISRDSSLGREARITRDNDPTASNSIKPKTPDSDIQETDSVSPPCYEDVTEPCYEKTNGVIVENSVEEEQSQVSDSGSGSGSESGMEGSECGKKKKKKSSKWKKETSV